MNCLSQWQYNFSNRIEAEGMTCIVNIDNKDSIDLVKVILNAGIHVRHVKNMPPMNFGVSDKGLGSNDRKDGGW